jgi:hypothetical protein
MADLSKSREIAAFNLALPYLMRINSILTGNYQEYKAGNSAGFAINLKQLYRELSPWLRPDEIEQMKKEFKELAAIPKPNKEKLWEKMENIEEIMRKHFKDLGMLMPKVQDSRFLFQKQR